MRFILSLTIFMLCMTLTSNELVTVSEVNLEKYSGQWHEFARYPNRFQKNCKTSTARYTILNNNKIEVYNECIDNNNHLKNVKGKAWLANKNDTAKLKVSFFWPFSGNYWIIGLDNDYQWAIVSEPKKKYLWILTRESDISIEDWIQIESILNHYNFDIQKLIFSYNVVEGKD